MDARRRRFSMALFWLPLFFAPLLLFAFCQNSRDKFIKIYLPDGGSITAELAVTEEEKQLGLMFREKMEPDQGMLFVFDEEGIQPFWMKNTLIPLDMLWLDKDKRVVHIEANVPPCQKDPCPSYQSGIPAMFVLELKAGISATRALKLFDRVDFILPPWVRK